MNTWVHVAPDGSQSFLSDSVFVVVVVVKFI